MSSAVASRFDERQRMISTGYSIDDMPEHTFFESSFSVSAVQLFHEFQHGDTNRKFDASHLFYGESHQQQYVAASYKTAGDAATAAPLDSSATNHGEHGQCNYSRFLEPSHGFQPSTLATLSSSCFVPNNDPTSVDHHGAAQNTAAVVPSSNSHASEEPPPTDDFIIDEFDEMLNQLFLFGEDLEIQVQPRSAAAASSPSVEQAVLAPPAQDVVDVDSKVPAAMNAAITMTKATTTEKSSCCATNDVDAVTAAKRARKYQTGQWDHRLRELLEFQSQHGHTFVPHSHPPNQKLAQWVKRQRYQHKLKQCGHHSTLSDEREGILNKAGFIWDSHAASWREQFQLLEQFSRTYGHCNVPTRYNGSTALNVWCKHQRKQYKLFKSRKPCSLNEERLECLNSIGFNWHPRSKSLA